MMSAERPNSEPPKMVLKEELISETASDAPKYQFGGGIKLETQGNNKDMSIPHLLETWDESTCTAALAHLEELRDEIHKLKNLPLVLQSSLLRLDLSPEQYSELLVKVTQNGSELLDAFIESWTSDMTKEIIDYANGRQAADGDLLPSLEIPEFGWKYSFEENADSAVATQQTELARTEKSAVKGILESFKARHPSLTVETTDGAQSIQISPIEFYNHALTFTVTASTSDNFVKYHVECKGGGPIGESVSRFVSSTPQLGDLEYILNMIAAYLEQENEDCVVCQTLVGPDWQIPTGRILDREKSRWVVVHERCSTS